MSMTTQYQADNAFYTPSKNQKTQRTNVGLTVYDGAYKGLVGRVEEATHDNDKQST